MVDLIPSRQFIEYICDLYGDRYDDRLEDCKPPVAGDKQIRAGDDWAPGQKAKHKSLVAFQRELLGKGIHLSSSKIRKILITGECWSTSRSREIYALYEKYRSLYKDAESDDVIVKRIASELGISNASVCINLPYQNVVYKLDSRSSNAKRCARYKEKKKAQEVLSSIK